MDLNYLNVKDHKVKKHYRVSFCTTCMDRLSDLRLTLPKNIKYNLEYPNVEFVLFCLLLKLSSGLVIR